LGAFSLAVIVLEAELGRRRIRQIGGYLPHWTYRKNILQAGSLSGSPQQFESAADNPLMGGKIRWYFHPKGL
jgi:hypothetical protein